VFRANTKNRYNTKDEALNHFHTERNEKLNGAEGWVEKPGPELPPCRQKSLHTQQKKVGVKSRREAVKDYAKRLTDMKVNIYILIDR
jgi:hypothetical protein